MLKFPRIWLTPFVFTPREAQPETLPFSAAKEATITPPSPMVVEQFVTISVLKAPTMSRRTTPFIEMKSRRRTSGTVITVIPFSTP